MQEYYIGPDLNTQLAALLQKLNVTKVFLVRGKKSYKSCGASDVMDACLLYTSDAYGLEVVAGRGFSEEYGDDVNKLVINETAARMLGYVDNDDAIGEDVYKRQG